MFHLHGKSLTDVDDEYLLLQIADFVVSEEKKFKSGDDSIFKYCQDTYKSHPRGGFCSAAIKHLQRYQTYALQEIESNAIADQLSNGKEVSSEMLDHFDITKEDKNQISKTKIRIGQAYYRKIIISLSEGQA